MADKSPEALIPSLKLELALESESDITSSWIPSVVVDTSGSAAKLDSKSTFLSLFSSRYGSRIRTASSDTWRSLSQFHSLTDEEIVSAVSMDSRTVRALCLDTKERFILIEFDQTCLDNDQGIRQGLFEALGRVGINGAKLFQPNEVSSYQCFLPLTKAAAIAPLAEAMKQYLQKCGLDEVRVAVPGDYFVLPLQPGFRWMNQDVKPMVARREMDLEKAIDLFVSEIKSFEVCPDNLMECLDETAKCLDIRKNIEPGCFVTAGIDCQDIPASENSDTALEVDSDDGLPDPVSSTCGLESVKSLNSCLDNELEMMAQPFQANTEEPSLASLFRDFEELQAKEIRPLEDCPELGDPGFAELQVKESKEPVSETGANRVEVLGFQNVEANSVPEPELLEVENAESTSQDVIDLEKVFELDPLDSTLEVVAEAPPVASVDAPSFVQMSIPFGIDLPKVKPAEAEDLPVVRRKRAPPPK